MQKKDKSLCEGSAVIDLETHILTPNANHRCQVNHLDHKVKLLERTLKEAARTAKGSLKLNVYDKITLDPNHPENKEIAVHLPYNTPSNFPHNIAPHLPGVPFHNNL